MIPVMKAVRMVQRRPDLQKPLLITIGTSHFAEKARWCLDLSPLRDEYVEEMHCPAFHLSSTLQLDPLPRVRTWPADPATSDPSPPFSFAASLQQRHPRVKEKTGVPKLVLPAAFLASHPQSAAVQTLTSKGLPLSTPPLNDGSSASTSGSDIGSVVVQGGSAGIMRFLSDLYPEELGHLYPSPDTSLGQQVLDLDLQLDLELGPAATTWCFANMLLTGEDFSSPPDSSDVTHSRPPSAPPRNSASINTQSVQFMLQQIRLQDVPLVEKFLFCNFGPKYLVPLMLRANRVSASEKQRAKQTIRDLFSRMDTLLQASNSRRTPSCPPCFLLGTQHLTAADITFASLAAPVLMPPQMNLLLPRFSAMEGVIGEETAGCVELADFARELRNKHISAQLCLHLYENHRFPPPPSSAAATAQEQVPASSSSYDTEGEYDKLIISPGPVPPPPEPAVVHPKTAQRRKEEARCPSSFLARLGSRRPRNPTSCRPER